MTNKPDLDPLTTQFAEQVVSDVSGFMFDTGRKLKKRIRELPMVSDDEDYLNSLMAAVYVAHQAFAQSLAEWGVEGLDPEVARRFDVAVEAPLSTAEEES